MEEKSTEESPEEILSRCNKMDNDKDTLLEIIPKPKPSEDPNQEIGLDSDDVAASTSSVLRENKPRNKVVRFNFAAKGKNVSTKIGSVKGGKRGRKRKTPETQPKKSQPKKTNAKRMRKSAKVFESKRDPILKEAFQILETSQKVEPERSTVKRGRKKKETTNVLNPKGKSNNAESDETAVRSIGQYFEIRTPSTTAVTPSPVIRRTPKPTRMKMTPQMYEIFCVQNYQRNWLG